MKLQEKSMRTIPFINIVICLSAHMLKYPSNFKYHNNNNKDFKMKLYKTRDFYTRRIVWKIHKTSKQNEHAC